MSRVLRFVRRKGDPNDGLIIGSLFRDSSDLIKKNTIYELHIGNIVDPDYVTLKEIGESEMGEPDGTNIHNWGHSINDILSFFKGVFLLTKKEYAQLLESKQC